MDYVAPDERYAILDVLRGVAVMGMLFVMVEYIIVVNKPITEEDTFYFYLMQLFVDYKFQIIFAFVFGYSIYQLKGYIEQISSGWISDNVDDKDNRLIAIALRGAGILIIFAIFQFLSFTHSFLGFYAIYGLIAAYLSKFSRKVNIVLFIILLLFEMTLESYAVRGIAYIYLGVLCAKSGMFENVVAHKKKWFMATLVLGALAVVGWMVQYSSYPGLDYFLTEPTEDTEAMFNGGEFVGDFMAPVTAAFYACVFVGIAMLKIGRMLLTPLRIFGLLGLTNYILLPMVIHFVDLVAVNIVSSYVEASFITAPIIILIAITILWVLNVGWLYYCYYGPFEWIWRMVAYWTPLDLRRHND